MKTVEFIEYLKNGGSHSAIFHGDSSVTYIELYEKILSNRKRLKLLKASNTCVLFVGDYNVNNISMLFALWAEGNVVALSSNETEGGSNSRAKASGAQFIIRQDRNDHQEIIKSGIKGKQPPNVETLIETKESGFIVFSSGSTGPAKGVVHRLSPFLERYSASEHCGTMLAFLLFDHIGGLVTLFQVLATYGTLAIPNKRSPDEVGLCIERFKINTLHVSPTLLNLALISGVFGRCDTTSLKRIYYGSEPISLTVLERIESCLPKIELTQLYGMSEIGVLPCQSKKGDSQWIKIDTLGYNVKCIDGICHVLSVTTMVGYLNDSVPLPERTFFNTGDLIETDGDYFRIKGRQANLINVGGSNVCPTDVERVLETCGNISDVVVFGEPNPIMGEVVSACFVLQEPELLSHLKNRVYEKIRNKLTPEQIPRTITISKIPLHSDRFKKTRSAPEASCLSTR